MMGVLSRLDWLEQAVRKLMKRTTVGGGGVPPSAHAANHSNGGSDEINILNLGGYSGNASDVLKGDATWGTGSSYTDEQAQDAVGGILVDSASIDFTYTDASPTSITAVVKVAQRTRQITFTFDGQGSVLTTGKTIYTRVPVACTIIKAYLVADVAGDLIVDAWKDTFANYPPTNADSLTASATPELISGAITYEDTTLSGWTTSLSAGDWVGASIEGTPATVTWAQLVLEVTVN